MISLPFKGSNKHDKHTMPWSTSWNRPVQELLDRSQSQQFSHAPQSEVQRADQVAWMLAARDASLDFFLDE